MAKDHKIVLLPIHGHIPRAEDLEEILRITPEIAVLIDSERSAPTAPLDARRQEFLDLCATKKIPAHAVERRATENYFPDDVIKRAFGREYRALDAYERLNNANPHWGKSENWKLAAGWPLDEVMATDLGKFLADL